MNFIIPLVIYPFDILFSVGETNKQLRKKLKGLLSDAAFEMAYDSDFLDNFNPDSKTAGLCQFLRGHQKVIIRLGRNASYGVVAHEIFHAISMILIHLKMPLSHDNDEAYAYLIEYLTEEFYRIINQNK